jgi:putative hydrolase of the HAD superfamily
MSHVIGLISDGLHEVQSAKLRALGIADSFDAVVFSDRFGKEAWKPSTKPFEIALSMLGSAANESIYIADNPLKDFLGARILGMGSIRVRHEGGYYSRCEPPTSQHAPDHQVEDIADIERIILES